MKKNIENWGNENNEKEKIFYLNFWHYSTILDKNIDLEKFKENIKKIFNENFDIFFSDLFPNKIWWEKNILETKIEEKNSSLEIKWLDWIDLKFNFEDLRWLKKISLDIGFKKKDLSEKQNYYLKIIFLNLSDLWLEFNFLNSHFTNSNIWLENVDCKDWICNFVKSVKDDLEGIKENSSKWLLEYIIADNFIEIDKIIEQNNFENIKDLKELKKLNSETFWNEN